MSQLTIEEHAAIATVELRKATSTAHAASFLAHHTRPVIVAVADLNGVHLVDRFAPLSTIVTKVAERFAR